MGFNTKHRCIVMDATIFNWWLPDTRHTPRRIRDLVTIHISYHMFSEHNKFKKNIRLEMYHFNIYFYRLMWLISFHGKCIYCVVPNLFENTFLTCQNMKIAKYYKIIIVINDNYYNYPLSLRLITTTTIYNFKIIINDMTAQRKYFGRLWWPRSIISVTGHQQMSSTKESGQLLSKATRTQDNSYPKKSVHKKTRTQINLYPGPWQLIVPRQLVPGV